MPTTNTPTTQSYPKRHLFAASGIAALLCLTLLVYPSREVEAKKTFINIELEEQSFDKVTEKASSHTKQLLDAESLTQSAAPVNTVEPEAVFEYEKTFTVNAGDSLSILFVKAGLDNNLLHSILSTSKEAKRFTHLKVGQKVTFEFNDDKALQKLSSQISPLETIYLEKKSESENFIFSLDIAPTQIVEKHAQGTIKGALFSATKQAGLPNSIAFDMAKIFGYDIDFAQDLRAGDKFELIYEEKVAGETTVGTGSILSARFTNRGKVYTAVRYTDKQGNSSYYAADGSSLRKAFIRTPVDFARISSRFSNGRKHPILNKIRAHKGVDYAAPRGTPIKATGDGKVALAGRNGGYGNTVVIKHGRSYQTLYAHMNGFAKGIRAGSNVKQGQVIGYIGTTGLSTGPHLHYEFQVNGVHVDPLSQKMPISEPIHASEKQRFAQHSTPLLAKLDQYKNTQIALNK